MEACGINLSVWTLLLFVLLWLLYRYMTATFNTFEQMGIPGPKPIPIFGTTHLMFKGTLQHDLEMHRKYGKFIGLFNSRTPVLMINDLEFLKHIMVKDFSSFRNRQSFPLEPPLDQRVSRLKEEQWKYVRSHVTSAFSGQKLRRMVAAINKCSKRLIKHIGIAQKAGDSFECKEYLSSITMDAIASTAFNIDIDTHTDKDNIFARMAKGLFDKDKKWLRIFLITAVPAIGRFLMYIGVEIISKEAVNFFLDITRKAMKYREENLDEVPNDFLQLLLASRVDKEGELSVSSTEEQKRQACNKEL